MKNIKLLFAVMALLVFSSCNLLGERVVGNGKITTEERHTDKVEKLKVLGEMDVIVNEGPSSVRVEADENVLPYIITETNGEWLEIRNKSDVNIDTREPVKVYVTTPSISNIVLTGSGNITGLKKFNVDNNIELNISGSGDITFGLHAPHVDATISGSGTMNVSGEARDADITVTGSGNFKGHELSIDNAKVRITGSGDADVLANNNLSANIVGSGNINCTGKAKVEKNIIGSGSVNEAH